MSSFCKCNKNYFNKIISIYAIFNDQSFNNTLTNDMLVLNNLARTVSLSVHTVFDLIIAHTPIRAQSSNFIVFRLQPMYFCLLSIIMFFVTHSNYLIVGSHLNDFQQVMAVR